MCAAISTASSIFQLFWAVRPAVRSEASRLLLISDRYRVGCALLIDAVVGLRNPQLFVLATDSSDTSPWVAAHYTDRDKLQWADLAVERLVQHPDFLDIGAALVMTGGHVSGICLERRALRVRHMNHD